MTAHPKKRASRLNYISEISESSVENVISTQNKVAIQLKVPIDPDKNDAMSSDPIDTEIKTDIKEPHENRNSVTPSHKTVTISLVSLIPKFLLSNLLFIVPPVYVSMLWISLPSGFNYDAFFQSQLIFFVIFEVIITFCKIKRIPLNLSHYFGFLISYFYVTKSIFQIFDVNDTLLNRFIHQQLLSLKGSVIHTFFVLTTLYFFHLIVSYLKNIYSLLSPTPKTKKIKRTKVPPLPDINNELELCIGEVHNPNDGTQVKNASLLTIKKSALFTNIFIFGTIGTGKTLILKSLLAQLFKYKSDNEMEKIGGLFIDVKGTLSDDIIEIAKLTNRVDDVYQFNLTGKIIWNPIHYPELDSGSIARFLKIMMESTVEKSADWIRNYAFDFLENAIQLFRLTNPNYYVTIQDIYQAIFKDSFVQERLNYLRNNLSELPSIIDFSKTDLKNTDIEKYLTSQLSKMDTYFNESWFRLKAKDPEVYGYISTSISQLLNPFLDPKLSHIFSPTNPNSINFMGFDWLINHGKLFVFNVPDSIYFGLGKYISLFMKLPFQKTCLARIPKTTPGNDFYDPNYNGIRPILFVADENQNSYHPSDNDALDKLREAKVIHICLTQSLHSLLRSNNTNGVYQYLTSFRNKLFLQASDQKDAEFYAHLCGHTDKEVKSFGYSESSRKASIDYLQGQVDSDDSNINSSVNYQIRKEFIFHPTEFYNLKKLQGIFIGQDKHSRMTPTYVYGKPHFINWNRCYFDFISDIN